MQKVTAALSFDAAQKHHAQQRKVADDVQNLVAHELVGKAQAVFVQHPVLGEHDDLVLQVALDVRITPELAREGMAREVVRYVQDARKAAGLEVEDRIELYLQTDAPELRAALEAFREYIAAETLAARWADRPLDGSAHTVDVRVDGKPLRIMLRKVSGAAPE